VGRHHVAARLEVAVNRVRKYLNLDQSTIDKLEALAEERGTYISRLVDEAVKLLPEPKRRRRTKK
jgi:hypothetical protein